MSSRRGGVAADRLLGQRLGRGACNHRFLHHVWRGSGGLRFQASALHLAFVDRSRNSRRIAHRCRGDLSPRPAGRDGT
eukprot:4180118-Pleurochrysis_carterae.AAC.1